MMRRLQLVSATLFATVIAGPVFAADMPLKAPPPPVYSSWDGVYLGGQIGGQWVKNDWTTTCVDAGGPPLGTCGSALSLVAFPGAPDATAAHTFNNSAFRAGFYIGAMKQIQDRWV